MSTKEVKVSDFPLAAQAMDHLRKALCPKDADVVLKCCLHMGSNVKSSNREMVKELFLGQCGT